MANMGRAKTLKVRAGPNRFKIETEDGQFIGEFIILVENRQTFIKIRDHGENLAIGVEVKGL